MKPRQYTSDEIRDQFLESIWMAVDEWAKTTHAHDERDRCSGLAHSILTIIDGLDGGFRSGFHLVPTGHYTNPSHWRGQGKNWWPVNDDFDIEKHCVVNANDILNDIFYEYDPKRKQV